MLRPGLTAIIIIAMLAWAGHSLARLFWLFNTPQPVAVAGSVLPSTQPVARNNGQAGGVDVAYLQENFRISSGRTDIAPSAAGGESAQAANTRLSLALRGAIAGSAPTDSSAIIASGEQQRVYFVGDELQFTTPGVTLDSVHPLYVVLNNNGRLETLWMYEPQASVSVPVTGIGTSGVIATRADADQAMASQLNERVQIRVYRENGAVRGFQIREDSDPAMLTAAGLQAGDIITSVDGVAVNQNNDLSSLTRELENQDRVDLELIRNNTTMTVTVSRDAFAF